MKVYGLTDLGKKVFRQGGKCTPEEAKVIDYVGSNQRVTEGDLEVVADRYTVKKLANDHILKVLNETV